MPAGVDRARVPARVRSALPRRGARAVATSAGAAVNSARLARFTRAELPTLNAAIDDAGGLQTLAAHARRATAWVRDGGADGLRADQAFAVLQPLTFIVGSLERELQRRGEPAGAGVVLLGLDAALQQLGARAEHPPCGTAETHWLRNDPVAPFMHLPERGERVFGTAVCLTDRRDRESVALLRPIRAGELWIASPEAVLTMHAAAANVDDARRSMAHMWARLGNGERRLDVMFFMTRLRTFLPAYPVAGELRSGANAANVAGWTALDHAVGMTDAAYAQITDERMRWMSRADASFVRAARSDASVLELLLAALDVTNGELAAGGADVVLAAVARAPALRRAVIACAKLCTAVAQRASAHYGLIRHYVIEPSRELTAQQRAQLGVVAPDAGSGGHSHDETWKLVEMRTLHPAATAVRAAAKRLDERAA